MEAKPGVKKPSQLGAAAAAIAGILQTKQGKPQENTTKKAEGESEAKK